MDLGRTLGPFRWIFLDHNLLWPLTVHMKIFLMKGQTFSKIDWVDVKFVSLSCTSENRVFRPFLKTSLCYFMKLEKFKNCNWHYKEFDHIVRKGKKTSWISMRYETNLLLLIIYPTACDLRSTLQMPSPCSRHNVMLSIDPRFFFPFSDNSPITTYFNQANFF